MAIYSDDTLLKYLRSINWDTTLSSEDVIRAKDQENAPPLEVKAETTAVVQAYKLVLVNSSDTPGKAGSLQTQLEAAWPGVSLELTKITLYVCAGAVVSGFTCGTGAFS